MVYSYARMVTSLRGKSTAVVAPVLVSSAPFSSNHGPHTMMRAQKNLLKTLVLVSSSFVVCWSWNALFFLVANLGYRVVYGHFYHFTVVMVFLNSCVNPFIYICQYREFQRGLKKLLGRETSVTQVVHAGSTPLVWFSGNNT